MGRRLLPALTGAWMGALLYLSVRPPALEAGPGGFTIPAPIQHLAGYGLLGALMGGTLGAGDRPRLHARGLWAAATLLAFLWGTLNEGLQAFSPGRSPDWRDALLNGLGSGMGALGAVLALAVARGRLRQGRGHGPASDERPLPQKDAP